MSIPATERVFGTGPTVPAADTGASTTTSTSADKDMFLQLLVAQMKYQDPLNPTDSGEFLAQSAQFTALEKMQDVADQINALTTAQVAFGASALAGREVTWLAEDGSTQSGLVSGVTFTPDGPVLTVDGREVALGSVSSVVAPGTGSTSTTSTTDITTAG